MEHDQQRAFGQRRLNQPVKIHKVPIGRVEALQAGGIAPDPAIMSSDEMSEVAGFRAAEHMLRLAEPPTAFLASSMISGMGIRRAQGLAGLERAQDLLVVRRDAVLSKPIRVRLFLARAPLEQLVDPSRQMGLAEPAALAGRLGE